MAVYVERFGIKQFRGIGGLELEDLNHVNIIAGDNNSGKTSVLEAMLLLRNPKNFNNILRIARMRDNGSPSSTLPTFDNFINVFPRNSDPLEVSIDGVCMSKSVMVCIKGFQKTILLEPEELYGHGTVVRKMRSSGSLGETEASAFTGELKYDVAGDRGSSPIIEFHSHSRTTGREIEKDNYMNIIYLSPTDHIRSNKFSKIVRDDLYKEICVNVLRLFDSEILDILYLKNETTDRPIEYVKHATLGNMPLSTYGDGIKKVLSLANGIAQASNGILMLDELETSIHAKYYDDIFRFVVKACKQFQVQLFVTTHSIEAIDALLATQDYGQHESDNISVITFRKDEKTNKTLSRTLPGEQVFKNRGNFSFEVRI